MTRVALALGSNVGDRVAHLDAAKRAIAHRIGPVVAESALYETAPIGGPEQGPYLNAVVVVETDLPPTAVLARVLDIERSRGRERGERWAPRTLDVDIVLHGEATVNEPGLTVPHPRLAERRFVVEPLLDAWPEAALPDGTRVADLLPAVADQQVVEYAAEGRPSADSVQLSAWESVVVFVTVGLVAAAMWWVLGQFL